MRRIAARRARKQPAVGGSFLAPSVIVITTSVKNTVPPGAPKGQAAAESAEIREDGKFGRLGALGERGIGCRCVDGNVRTSVLKAKAALGLNQAVKPVAPSTRTDESITQESTVLGGAGNATREKVSAKCLAICSR